MSELYGYEVPTDRALRTLREVLAGPINFLDTSNNYGHGESERRIGAALREAGGLPEGFVLATKVDLDEHGAFSGARVRRSLRESMERLGLERQLMRRYIPPERVEETLELARWAIPEALWDELEPLAAPPELWLEEAVVRVAPGGAAQRLLPHRGEEVCPGADARGRPRRELPGIRPGFRTQSQAVREPRPRTEPRAPRQPLTPSPR